MEAASGIRGKRGRVVAAFVAVVALWAVATGLLGPHLIRSGARGESFELVDRYFELRVGTPVEYYLAKLRVLFLTGLLFFGLAGCALAALAHDASAGWRKSRAIVGVATPGALGFVRVVVGAILLGMTLWEDLPSLALVPRELMQQRGTGVMAVFPLLPGYERLIASASALAAVKAVVAASLLLATLGLWTRLAVPAALVGYVFYGGLLRSYCHFFHTGAMPVYALALLCLVPCGDGLSLDRRMRRARGLPVAPADEARAVYAWGRFGCWLIIALCYFAAGLAKVRNGGLAWADPVNLKSMVLACALDPMQFDFRFAFQLVDAPDALLFAIGVGTIVIEMGMIVVPFSRRARRVFPWLAVAMHLGILLAQNILFLDLMLLQLIFLEPERWFRRAGTPLAEEAARRPTGWNAFVPAAVLLVASAYVCCIVVRAEFYPLTTWQMFSHRVETSAIRYQKLLARHGDQPPVEARPEQQIGVLWDTRYRDLMWPAWQTEEAERGLHALLRTCAAEHNRASAPEDRIVAYELELWEWDWRAAPDDPSYGKVIDSRTFDVLP